MVRVDVQLAATDPTGAECDCCGDVAYLSAWHLLVTVAGVEQQSGYLCQSCAESFSEQLG